MGLPPATARPRDAADRVAHARAVARHAARRSGAMAIAAAKVILWLMVVVTSLVAIASLGGRPRRVPDYQKLQRDLDEWRVRDESLRQSLRAIERDDQLRAIVRDLEALGQRPPSYVPPHALVIDDHVEPRTPRRHHRHERAGR
jgi:hypothetical protein